MTSTAAALCYILEVVCLNPSVDNEFFWIPFGVIFLDDINSCEKSATQEFLDACSYNQKNAAYSLAFSLFSGVARLVLDA